MGRISKTVLDKRTESVTLRVDSRTMEVLKRHAERSEISVNILANQILRGFIEWDMTAAKAGWAVLQKEVLKELFNSLGEERLREIAVKSADSMVDIGLLMRGEDNLEAFYSILRARVRRSGFRYTESLHNNTKTIAIQHDMGEKWSIFFKSHHERILQRIGCPVEISITPNTVVMEITEQGF